MLRKILWRERDLKQNCLISQCREIEVQEIAYHLIFKQTSYKNIPTISKDMSQVLVLLTKDSRSTIAKSHSLLQPQAQEVHPK